MSSTAPANSTLSEPPRPRRFQFGLLSLLIVITLLGVAFGIWVYYQPLIVSAQARFAIVDSTAAKAILAQHPIHSVSDSPYGWIVLSDAELADLLQLEGKPVAVLGSSMPHTVPYWPHTAFTGLYTKSRDIPVGEEFNYGPNFKLPVYEMGQISGTMGSRRASGKPQFRVECNMTCQHPDDKSISKGHLDAKAIKVKGKLFYEGPTPTGHLVFLAPVDDDVFSVDIFDVK
jgi:hypothetical protein